MGADLYIVKIQQTVASVDDGDEVTSQGYFRDAYNITNVLNTLGLSWWQDVFPLCTEDGLLEGNNLLRVRRKIIVAKQRFPSPHLLQTAGAESLDLAAWQQFYIDQRRKLLVFLDRAIAMNSAVRCAL